MPHHIPALVETVGEETLVYVPDTQQVHLLPPEISEVYRYCDARPLKKALEQLGEARLAESLPVLAERNLISGSSRRRFLQSAAAAALLTLAVPEPALAGSCITEASCNQANPPTGGAGTCVPCSGGNCPAGGCVCFCYISRLCNPGGGGSACAPGGSCAGDSVGNAGQNFCQNMASGTLHANNCDTARQLARNVGGTNYRCCESCTAAPTI